ncbi:hypothetical protein HGO21_25735 [Acinetobacter sp. CUI P1]|nr:hypothetical protein [Acinetobacter sp. CUI P1]
MLIQASCWAADSASAWTYGQGISQLRDEFKGTISRNRQMLIPFSMNIPLFHLYYSGLQ